MQRIDWDCWFPFVLGLIGVIALLLSISFWAYLDHKNTAEAYKAGLQKCIVGTFTALMKECPK